MKPLMKTIIAVLATGTVVIGGCYGYWAILLMSSACGDGGLCIPITPPILAGIDIILGIASICLVWAISLKLSPFTTKSKYISAKKNR